ncbi:antibiotic biosynthesis monooxygenase family protein [Actinomadura gamaensis]|uniref:Antibiotic biosynthesis monooxygenase family protein n=1 Tax=Actinomadura gamaensis TaxID=1763541 RepID=A0ABV9TY31_9ACTN
MVVFVNKITLTGPAAELERIYEAVAAFMSGQAGLIRFQLVRSSTDPDVYFNIAEWKDQESFDRARTQEKFAKGERIGAVSTGDRHVCEVVFEGVGDVTPGRPGGGPR